ncbi:MAG: GNAT family N-acetyltransferase [Halanaerobium sp.]|nr:GNAT family N-acetyltransferase [Halanaerobium sp.]
MLADGDEPVGRIGYWSTPEEQDDLRIFGLVLPWSRTDVVNLGVQLVKASLQRINGYQSVGALIDSGEPESFQARKEIMENSGLELTQAKRRLSLKRTSFQQQDTNRLEFRSLDRVGEEAFIEAIRRVSHLSLDREDRRSAQELGEEEAARQHFQILKSIEYVPERWQLGYNGTGQLVGLVVLQQEQDTGTGIINYIGVVPEERGNGYVLDLLAHGVSVLFGQGFPEIIADIDVDNFPMELALQDLGFVQDDEILRYKLTIDTP